MSTKAPRTTSAPKVTEVPKNPLYTVVRDRLAAKDAETLDARTEEALKRVEAALDGVGTVSATATEASVVLGKLDPGEEAAGKCGFFFGYDGNNDKWIYGKCGDTDNEEPGYCELSFRNWYNHFIEAPKTGAALDAVLDLIAKEAGK